MFKRRSLLSFKRPKTPGAHTTLRKGKTLVLSSPSSASGFVTPAEHATDCHDNQVPSEPLFHEDYITPTEESRCIEDQFEDYISSPNPEVDCFLGGLNTDSDILLVQDDAYDDDDDISIIMECVTIDEVGVSYPSGSVKLIDHDPWGYAGIARPPDSDDELSSDEKYPLELPPRSPYRTRADSASFGSAPSSPSISMPPTPETSGWPLPNPGEKTIHPSVEAQIVEA